MKTKYISPKIEIIDLETEDIIMTSGNINTSSYGFQKNATHTNQGQEWLDIWN